MQRCWRCCWEQPAAWRSSSGRLAGWAAPANLRPGVTTASFALLTCIKVHPCCKQGLGVLEELEV
jgi:hypothetical protein